MKDDDWRNWAHFQYTPTHNSSYFYDLFKKAEQEVWKVTAPTWIGADWAENSGMSRGDVVERHGNVTHVRFKTVTIG